MSKKGIPRKKPEDKRSTYAQVRMTQAEKIDFKKLAGASGISLSDLFRQAIKRVRPWTPEHKEIEKEKIRQLARIGNNLNQIARAVNTQGVVNFEMDILEKLSHIETEITTTLKSKGGD